MKVHMIDIERSKKKTFGGEYLVWTECGHYLGFFPELPEKDEVLTGKNVIPNTRRPEKVTCKNCQKNL